MRKVHTISTAEAIVNQILEMIQNGTYGPGTQLPSERELQERFGVSRLSLREALARLSALGIVRVQHGKGAFVREGLGPGVLSQALVPLFPGLDPKRLMDLLEARRLIEGEVTALAAGRHTAADLAELERLLEYDDQVLEDAESFAERDYRFHRKLAEIAGNQFLAGMLDALAAHTRAFLVEYAQSVSKRRQAMDRHRPLLQAIRAGDPEKARELSREHIQGCYRSYAKRAK